MAVGDEQRESPMIARVDHVPSPKDLSIREPPKPLGTANCELEEMVGPSRIGE